MSNQAIETSNEKVCFVIMPITDFHPYSEGHFKRVYEYIIKPACTKAGFKAIRGDDVTKTNFIAIDILKNIMEADMAICDLSGKNPNVLYELGIRQAFNKPVTLIKDESTGRIFDIQGFRNVDYPENLRIDTVNLAIKSISENLLNTYESSNSDTSDINSLVQLLGVEPAKIQHMHLSDESSLILNSLEEIKGKLSAIEPKKVSSKLYTSKKMLSTLLEESGYECYRCAKPIDLDNAAIEHLVQRETSNKNSLENMVAVCRTCIYNGKGYIS